jgi:hypothetical protein
VLSVAKRDRLGRDVLNVAGCGESHDWRSLEMPLAGRPFIELFVESYIPPNAIAAAVP